MKVLMLTQSVDSYRPGPVGFAVDWVRVLAAKVDKLYVLTYNFDTREELPANVQVKVISGRNFLTRSISLVFNTIRFGMKVDVIFAHILEIFAVIGSLIGELIGKRCFFWYSSGYDLTRHWGAKMSLFFADVVFTSVPELEIRYREQLGNWVRAKIKVVGQGLYLPHYSAGRSLAWPKGPKPIRIYYVGRTVPVKGVPVLIAAIGILKKSGYKIDFRIISSYRYHDSAKIFQSANIIVVPTFSYSPDKVFFEGLASGVTTLGTDVAYPSIREKFPQLIFSAGESKELAVKLTWLITHRDLTKSLTGQARDYVKTNFDLEKLMDKVVYEFSNYVSTIKSD